MESEAPWRPDPDQHVVSEVSPVAPDSEPVGAVAGDHAHDIVRCSRHESYGGGPAGPPGDEVPSVVSFKRYPHQRILWIQIGNRDFGPDSARARG